MGVRDSKLLTKKKRELLYDQIFSVAENVKVDKIWPSEINESMKNNISLNELEAVHFARLFDLIEVPISRLYLDSPDVIEERFGIRINMLSGKPTSVSGIRKASSKAGTKVISEHKADSRYPVVSAASIIAKVERDREIRHLSKALKINIGSGYPSDYITIDAVRKNIKNPELNKHVRVYWKTFSELKQMKLNAPT